MLNRERRRQAFSNIWNGDENVDQNISYDIVNKAEGKIEIAIRGVVGDLSEECDHSSVVEALKDDPKANVTLYVNSMGGSVFDGFGIMNALLAHEGEVTAVIEGVAYSAASFLVLAADRVCAYKASTFGVHRSLTFTYGNQKAHAATIERLNAIDEILIELYVEKTGLSTEEIENLLDGTSDGTMLKASEAKEKGFIDEVLEPKKKKKTDSNFSQMKAEYEQGYRERVRRVHRAKVEGFSRLFS